MKVLARDVRKANNPIDYLAKKYNLETNFDDYANTGDFFINGHNFFADRPNDDEGVMFHHHVPGFDDDTSENLEFLIRSVFELPSLAAELEADKLADALKNEGESKNQPDDKYDLGQLTNGTFVETEHTDDLKAAKEIAKDHLEEDPEYYSKGDFPEEAEEAKEKILSDENCKDVYIKSKPYDAVLGCRANTILSGLAELIGGK